MKYFLVILCCSIAASGAAQNILNRSLDSYQAGKLDEAKLLIDSAMTSELYAQQSISWYLKGFIYKDLYKENTSSRFGESARMQAITSFNKLLEIDTLGEYEKEARQNLVFLATTYYNQAMKLTQEQQLDTAVYYYKNFEEVYVPLNDTTISLEDSKAKFYFALGTGYVRRDALDSVSDHGQRALQAFEEVLAIDSMDKEANYNIGVIYYNEAVSKILEIDYDDADILAFGKFEDQTIDLFKKSLPYMKRAYRQDPKDKNILEGLAGIHFGLREFEVSNKYKMELIALEDR